MKEDDEEEELEADQKAGDGAETARGLLHISRASACVSQ